MEDKALLEQEFIPVFLIDGFLEAGKTQFLHFTMQQDYFQTDGKTLLLVCEEGETQYEPDLLEQTNTVCVYVESPAELTKEKIEELKLLHNPERLLLEWNGMWNLDDLKLPEDFRIYQQITVIDMSTFDLYAANMKPLLYSMVKDSELVICNRCDEIGDLSGYRRMLKAMCQKGEVVFENSQGEIDEIDDEDLPYDVAAEVIEISPEDYGIWYIDCLERRDRYEGKTVEFTAMVLKTPDLPKNYFISGRLVMTCCEDDMRFLGFVTKGREAKALETKQWVKVRAKVAYEYWKDYEGDGPVLYTQSVLPAEEIRQAVQF